MNPVITVCLMVYNHESFIEQALAGLLMQDCISVMQLIIHDDCSTDNSLKIIKNFQKANQTKFNEIIVIEQSENQYVRSKDHLVRFVLPLATGKYIALIQGDDFWSVPNRISMQLEIMEKNPQYSISYGDVKCIDETGEDLAGFETGAALRDLSQQDLRVGSPINTPTAVFLNVFDKIDWKSDYSNITYIDRLIWSYLGLFGSGKYVSTIQGVNYRIHKNGIHSSSSKKNKLINNLIFSLCLVKNIGDSETIVRNRLVLRIIYYAFHLTLGCFEKSMIKYLFFTVLFRKKMKTY